ncbi:MAG: hypothetical protein WC663_05525 [Patescibacteria group bacterium]|jgi:hypothetical protein
MVKKGFDDVDKRLDEHQRELEGISIELGNLRSKLTKVCSQEEHLKLMGEFRVLEKRFNDLIFYFNKNICQKNEQKLN